MTAAATRTLLTTGRIAEAVTETLTTPGPCLEKGLLASLAALTVFTLGQLEMI